MTSHTVCFKWSTFHHSKRTSLTCPSLPPPSWPISAWIGPLYECIYGEVYSGRSEDADVCDSLSSCRKQRKPQREVMQTAYSQWWFTKAVEKSTQTIPSLKDQLMIMCTSFFLLFFSTEKNLSLTDFVCVSQVKNITYILYQLQFEVKLL